MTGHLLGTGQTAIYGLPLGTNGDRASKNRVRVTVEAVSSDAPLQHEGTRRLRVSVDEITAGKTVDTDILQYEYTF
jgi:hypothetical protein